VKVINPLLESAEEIGDSHRKREYPWITPISEYAKQLIGRGHDVTLFQYHGNNLFLPYPRIQVNEAVSELNRALYYGDFSRAHSSLVSRMRKYDDKAEDFGHLLLEFAEEILSSGLRELVEGWGVPEDPNILQQRVLGTTCLAFNKLLGASQSFSHDQVRDADLRQYLERYEDFAVKELGKSVNIMNKVQQIVKEADSFVEELKVIHEQLLKIKDGYRKDYHLTYEETEEKKSGPIY